MSRNYYAYRNKIATSLNRRRELGNSMKIKRSNARIRVTRSRSIKQHDYAIERGIREQVNIKVILHFAGRITNGEAIDRRQESLPSF